MEEISILSNGSKLGVFRKQIVGALIALGTIAVLLVPGIPKPEMQTVVLEPSGRGISIPEVKLEEVTGRSADLDVEYEIITPRSAFALDIQSSSGIPLEFWEEFLPEDLQCIAEGLVYCDENEVNALYVYAVVVSEVGRTAQVVGKNNYFNFTPDTKYYTSYDTVEDCFEYSASRHQDAYFNSEWQGLTPINQADLPPYGTLNYQDDIVTITEVNRVYARYADTTINWYWQESVADIMSATSRDYLLWLTNNTGGNINVEST